MCLLTLTKLLQRSALSHVGLKPHTYNQKLMLAFTLFIPLVFYYLNMSMTMPGKKCADLGVCSSLHTYTELLIARARFKRNLVTYFIIFSLSLSGIGAKIPSDVKPDLLSLPNIATNSWAIPTSPGSIVFKISTIRKGFYHSEIY